jgi:Lipocalin-like domain
MFAYTGIFRLEGDKWTTEVDVAWNPVWNGTDQVRSFKLDGGRRKVTSAWGGAREPREDDSRRSDVEASEVARDRLAYRAGEHFSIQ